MSVINTNTLSLVTQNNLTKSQGALNSAIERLSSGMRINSAKDDAAGQAIANRFTATVKGLTQASRNASDGISMAQTTESALGEVNNNLQRIRELTVQSANGSNNDVDRGSMQAEITQRLEEITRLSDQTDFNGTKVLSANTTVSIQVGANDNEKISINLRKIDMAGLGLVGFNVDKSGTLNKAATQATLTAKLASTTGGTDPTQAGYKSITGFSTTGIPVSGTTAYTRTTTTKDASDTLGSSPTRVGANIADVFGAADGNTTVKLDGGTGIDSYTPSGSGSALRFNSSTGATASTTNASAAASLTASMTGTATAEVTLNNASQTVKIDGAGNITNEINEQLYLDRTGNLTSNAAGLNTTTDKATATSLAASMASAVGKSGAIVVTTQGGSTLTYTTAGTGANSWDVSNSLTLADMQAKSTAATTAVVDIDGAFGNVAYTVTGAGSTVKQGSSTVYIDPNPALSGAAKLSLDSTTTIAPTTGAVTTKIETYYVHSNGAVMDGSGNAVYEDSDLTNNSGLTLNARSGNTATVKPLEVLDAALKTVDNLRGALGAVQNRFDSTIASLGTTIVNLSSTRSRIEDADYAVEVSNMSRAQILQQAGTSVLAKANQSTEGVMSLLR